MQVLNIAPDLVVEVLSPSEVKSDLQEEVEDYRRIGVREGWLVNLEAETIEVLRLTSQGGGTAWIVGERSSGATRRYYRV